jgi:hypothetical protein
MTTAKWREIEPQMVSLTGLQFSQEHLTIEGLFKAVRGEASHCGDPYPHLVWFEGQTWVSDGHHRVVAAMILGQETIEARLLVKG